MARWTKEGWELLEGIALNAFIYTGFRASALRVLEDAQRVCLLIESNPYLGQKITNIFNEARYWHPFHEGKVLMWKVESQKPVFVGAFYSLPEVLIF